MENGVVWALAGRFWTSVFGEWTGGEHILEYVEVECDGLGKYWVCICRSYNEDAVLGGGGIGYEEWAESCCENLCKEGEMR